jgi:hypothetical protein
VKRLKQRNSPASETGPNADSRLARPIVVLIENDSGGGRGDLSEADRSHRQGLIARVRYQLSVRLQK